MDSMLSHFNVLLHFRNLDALLAEAISAILAPYTEKFASINSNMQSS